MASLCLSGVRVRVLGPVDLVIASAELVTLAGPSGSGKSLLLRALADLDRHEGEVRLDGTPRTALSGPQWRRRVGLLPAESHWWADQVGDHFPAPSPDAAPGPTGGPTGGPSGGPAVGSADQALRRLGFEPDVLAWSVLRLSSGERQRLALARLLANGPEALLLDEATANLDPVNRDRVEALVQDYRRERSAAVLWVSHDPEQRRRLGGRRLVICDGRLESEASEA